MHVCSGTRGKLRMIRSCKLLCARALRNAVCKSYEGSCVDCSALVFFQVSLLSVGGKEVIFITDDIFVSIEENIY